MHPLSAESTCYDRVSSLKSSHLGDHALIGVSPFNSYFSQSNLDKIISWGFYNFKGIHIFIPDKIYTYTFQALGYPIEKAIKKTKRQDFYLRNKVVKSFINSGVSESEIEKKIVFLSNVSLSKDYLKIYNECLKLFETDQFFRDGCLSTSKWVLDGKGISNSYLDENIINVAVKYFLAELPFFLNTPKILGIPSSVFVYQDMPEFLKNIYERGLFVSSKQGFLKMVLDH